MLLCTVCRKEPSCLPHQPSCTCCHEYVSVQKRPASAGSHANDTFEMHLEDKQFVCLFSREEMMEGQKDEENKQLGTPDKMDAYSPWRGTVRKTKEKILPRFLKKGCCLVWRMIICRCLIFNLKQFNIDDCFIKKKKHS